MFRLPHRIFRIWVDLPMMIKGMIVVALPLTCSLFSVVVLQVLQVQRNELTQWIGRAFQVGNRIQAIITLLTDAESGTRAFLLTHDAKYLEPGERAAHQLPLVMARLRVSLTGNSAELQRLQHIEDLSQERLATLKTIISLPDRLALRQQLDYDHSLMDSIQQDAANLRTGEANLWAARIAAEASLRKKLAIATYLAVICSVLVGGFTMALFVAGIVRRSQLLRLNADRLAMGESLVELPLGLDEIGHLGKALMRASHLLTGRELELRQLNCELDSRVQERTSQLEKEIAERRRSEDQLHQSQKLESIGRLAGGVAHDFNNILTIINGYSEMLLGELASDHPMREGLAEISAAGERAAGLTQQLLAFSRRQVVQPSVLNINHVVSDIQKMLRRLIGENIDLRTNLTSGLDNVIVDAGHLQQVIMNLVVNSRDAMPEGGVLLIETANISFDESYTADHPQVQPGRYVMLAVTDTGTGMTPEVERQAFEPFFTTKAQGVGTGLGLASVYGIVRQAQGWIWVYTELGRGTTFKVYLPSVDKPLPKLHSIPKTDVRGTETILLVEDQPDVSHLAVLALKKYGYTVYSAARGDEALTLAQGLSGNIDLLVTDVIMPGSNGRDLARQLTKDRPEMRVLLMSGYTDDATALHGAFEAGVPFLQKPFTPESLAEKVRTALGPRRVTPATVLIVDDEDSVRRSIRQLLTGAGYAVLEAINCRQAVEQLTMTSEIALLIGGLAVPEPDGLETIRSFREQKPGLKMIATSSAFGGGFEPVATFQKPIDFNNLLAAVRGALMA